MKHIVINYIYLLHEREHIRTSENVYKVGMTRQSNLERFNNYPKGSILLFQMECVDCKFVESIVLKLFAYRFKKCCLYGNEYFGGDKKHMMNIIYLIIMNEDKIRECTTDRSKYIDSILEQNSIVDKVTTIEPSETATQNIKISIENNETAIKSIETIPENIETVIQNNKTTIDNSLNNPKYQFSCNKCQYYTNNSSNYIGHLKTKKHKIICVTNLSNGEKCGTGTVTVNTNETNFSNVYKTDELNNCKRLDIQQVPKTNSSTENKSFEKITAVMLESMKANNAHMQELINVVFSSIKFNTNSTIPVTSTP
jgi:hypothetical protein